jgi:pimeloyl-ACP methyl ester carboxylesterase
MSKCLIFAGGLAMPPQVWALMPLRRHAQEDGWRTYYHRQGSRFGPISTSAQRLFEMVERKHETFDTIIVVGHSMGGLVAEHAAAMGAHIDGVATVGTPHQGTNLARLATVGEVLRDMAPSSGYLTKVALMKGPRPPLLAITTERDMLVNRSGSRPVRPHEHHLIRGVGHIKSIFEEETSDVILEWANRIASA